MSDTFRREYKPLTDEVKAEMEMIKVAAETLLGAMNQLIPSEERSERGRCMNIARTNLEQSIMWAVKGLTA